jgi:phage I-like protein
MAEIYCELGEHYTSAVTLPKYVTYSSKVDEHGQLIIKNGFVASVVYGSDRIWIQDDRGIRYSKHRWDNPAAAQVDLKEFVWVKLKSRPV